MLFRSARSYALRRRQQALIAEAIANGTYVPPKKPGALGEKPKMYEIFIGEEGEVEEEREEARDQSGERAASPEKQKLKEKEPERLEDGLALDWDRIMVRGVLLNVIAWKPQCRRLNVWWCSLSRAGG